MCSSFFAFQFGYVTSKRLYVAYETVDYNCNFSFKGEFNLKRQFNYLSVADYFGNIIYLKQKKAGKVVILTERP